MQIIRTIIWIVITAIVVAFMFMNWGEPVPVRFWPVEGGYFQFGWPVGFVALFFFCMGLVPMWLLHKAGRWRLTRRINALENSVRANTITPPLATTTQLEAETAGEAPDNSKEHPA